MQVSRYAGELEKAQDIALEVIRRCVPDRAYRVFLFGSRASGSAREGSDIDIGIEGPQPLSYEVLARIRGDLEEAPTLYSFDIVDFARVPAKFRTVARERVPMG